jgi:selenocysteine insertion sequence-binding protein 2
VRNKGKKREVKRIRHSRLKKCILKSREAKRKTEELKTVENLEENLANLEIKEESKKVEEPPIKHSRSFRPYCDHFITKEIRSVAETILKDLFRFQENLHKKNPVKAKANKRYVVGFSEVFKFLEAKKLKLIFISPDLEPNESVDQTVDRLKRMAVEKNVPYVFSIKRRHVGYVLLKKVPISCVGIFNFDGTHENVKVMLELVDKERNNYLLCKKVG